MRRKRTRQSAAQLRKQGQQLRERSPNRELTSAEIAEAQWLGCLLIDPSLLAKDVLPKDHFQVPRHRDLYSAILQIRAAGHCSDDFKQLILQLNRSGYSIEQAGALLDEIVTRQGRVASFDQYAAILRYRARGETAVAPQADPIESESSMVRRHATSSPFDNFSSAQLLDEDGARRWLLPGLLTQDEPAVIVGPSKSMKTSLSVDLCGALSTGGKFLGQFAAARPFRVGIMSGESGRHALRDLAQRWSAASNVNIRDNENLVWSLKIPNLADQASLQQLRDWIAEHQLEVVLFDPLYLMAPAVNPTNIFAMGAMLRELSECCLDLGATPILCHHTRKTIRARMLELTDMAGAGCQEFARQWLLINRRQKYEPGSGQHRLWLAIGGSAGQGGMWGVDIEEGRADDPQGRRWEVKLRDRKSLGDEEVEQEQVSLAERGRRKVRAAFKIVRADLSTKSRIKAKSGMNGARFGGVWDEMIESGEIIKVESEKDKTYPLYQLA